MRRRAWRWAPTPILGVGDGPKVTDHHDGSERQGDSVCLTVPATGLTVEEAATPWSALVPTSWSSGDTSRPGGC
jgi:hypothetical protein